MALFADVLLAGSGALSGAVAYVAWRNRPRAGTASLAGLVLSIALWSALHLANHHAAGAVEQLTERLEFAVLAPAGFFWFAFALAYTGRRDYLDRRGLAALFAWPVAVGIVVLIPESTGWPVAAWPAIEAERGPVFWGHVLVSYGLLAAGTVLVIQHLRATVGVFRRQGLVIVAGVLVAWAGSAVAVFELLGDVHLHALPAGFALMGAFLLWGILGTGLTRVTPIAHRAIVESLEAGVVAIDERWRVASVNPVARELLGVEADATIAGRPVADVLGDRPELADWVGDADPPGESRAETFQFEEAVIECELSPLYDDREQFVGAALLMYDVTEEHRRRERLAEQNEQLDRFGSVISHDLRNPLNVAKGHLELAEEEANSDHLRTVEDALDRMVALIDDLRTLAHQGQPIEQTETVSLAALSARSWGMVRAPEADFAVEDDLTFEADPDRCVQLLENLFRNAVEHGSEHSRASLDDAVERDSNPQAPEDAAANGGAGVSIRVGPIEGEGFYVADDGPGIPPEDRETVFESGYSTASDGTGLGLSIVAEIAEAHGWTVRAVESEAGGARIEITGVDLAA